MVELLAESARPWRRRVAATLALTGVLMGVAPGVVRAETYVVQPGDTLSEIARDHAVSMSEVLRLNGLTDPHRIRAGQRLELPSTGGGTTGAPATGGSYVVQPGDALSIIARDHGVSLDALMAANGITNPHRVRAGATLMIPGQAASVSLPAAIANDPVRRSYVPLFQEWAGRNGIDPNLLMGLAWQESGWNNDAVSSVGAVGIGQLMPGTSVWVAERFIGRPDLDPAVPEDNIRISARYLRYLLDRSGGDVEIALAGYFQGPNSVNRDGVLDISEGYVANVLELSRRFAGERSWPR